MITIEGDKNTLIITILEPKDDGYVGTSSEMSKASLINMLIEEEILEDGETVYVAGETEELK